MPVNRTTVSDSRGGGLQVEAGGGKKLEKKGAWKGMGAQPNARLGA